MRRSSWPIRTAVVVAVLLAVGAGCVPPGDPAPLAGRWFAQNGPTSDLVTGAWSWFEGPRAIVTADGCALLAGSSGRDTAGSVIEVGRWGNGPGVPSQTVLEAGQLAVDDHDSPGLVELGDGRILAAWAGHSQDDLLRSAVRDPDGTWHRNPDRDVGGKIEYNNVFRLGDGRVLDVIRTPVDATHPGDPTVFQTTDAGTSWTQLGRLLTFSNYFAQRPYVRFAQQGDRLDFIVSEGNPNTFPGSGVYHGYLENGGVHRSDGASLGVLGVGPPPEVRSFTPVFVPPAGLSAWTSDLAVDAAGHPVAVFSVRNTTVPWNDPTAIRYTWARWTGSSWTNVDLAPGGRALYEGEPNYSGNIAVDPADPLHVALSSSVDPRTGADLGEFDVFEMRTTDGGATWTTLRVTATSGSEYRPVFTNNADGVQALLWFSGAYARYNNYTTTVQYRIADSRPPGERATACGAPIDLGERVVTGDFDGDHKADALQYAPGFAADRVSWGALAPDTLVGSSSLNMPGSYTPITGDFDGNGHDDVLWYSSTTSSSTMWWSEAFRSFTSQTIATTPGLQPTAGDFDGDHRADLLWYGTGATPDSIWWGSGGRTFQTLTVSMGGQFTPFTGDFDGDHRADVLWYSAAGNGSKIWWAGPNRTFTTAAATAPASSRPLVDDFDGDGRSDIFWYGPGTAPDSISWAGASRTFTVQASAVYGTFTPFTGDFDGDGAADIYWNTVGASGARVWRGSTTRTFISSPGVWH